MNKKIVLSIVVALFMSACDIFDYHPYDGKITGERDINKKNISRIEQECSNKDTIRFAFLGDTQRCYDETEKFVKALNKRNDIDFVIHGGDLSDFGVTKEFVWMRNILSKLKVPYVALIGNHDCLANGEDIYRTIYGDPNFSFVAGKTKFVCLNTNALEYDYSRPVPDFSFIKDEINAGDKPFEKTIFAMHVPPFDNQFNNNVSDIFQSVIKEYPSLQFCIHAHTHKLTERDLFDDGIIYYSTPNIAKKVYLIFTIMPEDKYKYEVVEF